MLKESLRHLAVTPPMKELDVVRSPLAEVRAFYIPQLFRFTDGASATEVNVERLVIEPWPSSPY